MGAADHAGVLRGRRDLEPRLVREGAGHGASRGGSWVWHRERRLVRPLFVYLAVWVPLVLGLTEILPDAAAPLGKLSTQLLVVPRRVHRS